MTLVHWIVPNAGLQPFEQAASAFNPGQHLAALQEKERITVHELSLSMPCEIMHARALGLPSDEGRIPWAAWETQTLAQACAWVHPCHLDVGMTDMVLQPSEQLQLQDDESRQLHALMAPYFTQDGFELRYHSATRWLLLGEPLADFECASLRRVQGRSINEFLPDAGQFPQQTKLARLQAEMQMLLYTHPFNETRTARGLPSVNSFWLDGAGLLHTLPATAPQIKLDTRLQDAAHEPSAYLAAWQSLLQECQQQASQISRDAFMLSLCGEVAAISLQPASKGFLQHLRGFFGQRPADNLRSLL
jgi:hypothetical protein